MLVYYRINHHKSCFGGVTPPQNQYSESEQMFVLDCFVYHVSQCIHSKQTVPNNKHCIPMQLLLNTVYLPLRMDCMSSELTVTKNQNQYSEQRRPYSIALFSMYHNPFIANKLDRLYIMRHLIMNYMYVYCCQILYMNLCARIVCQQSLLLRTSKLRGQCSYLLPLFSRYDNTFTVNKLDILFSMHLIMLLVLLLFLRTSAAAPVVVVVVVVVVCCFPCPCCCC